MSIYDEIGVRRPDNANHAMVLFGVFLRENFIQVGSACGNEIVGFTACAASGEILPRHKKWNQLSQQLIIRHFRIHEVVLLSRCHPASFLWFPLINPEVFSRKTISFHFATSML